MHFFDLLADSPAALAAAVFILGLLVGSFLNVVIYRLPLMMERAWKRDAQEILELEPVDTQAEPFNLIVPRSRCPHCNHLIRWYENIPLLSWLALRGRCSACGARISVRYPVIELSAALIGLIAALELGYGWWLVAVLAASWMLLALAMIDYDTTLLPDQLTLPLLWGGLLVALLGIGPVSLHDAVIGAMAGYLSLWSVYWLFRLLTGKEGMGFGDFKLLAALGAWLGWQLIPLTILLSSVVGAVVGLLLIVTGAVNRNQGIPFGPYLAGAGWIALLWGRDLVDRYLGMFAN